MKTKTRETESESRTTGAHKLSEEFSVRLLGTGGLEDNGKMDLRNMNMQGILRDGKHTHGDIVEDIEAQARPVMLPNGRQSFSVVIQTKDRTAKYRGVLLLDVGGELAVSGFFKFTAARARKADIQNEGVWVITKP